MAFTKTAGAASTATSGVQKAPGTVAGWEPHVLWLLGLCIAEVFAVAFLSKHLLKG